MRHRVPQIIVYFLQIFTNVAASRIIQPGVLDIRTVDDRVA